MNIYKQTMKTSAKKAVVTLALVSGVFTAKAQITVTDFETFTLAPSSAYGPTNAANSPFTTFNASFQHSYDTVFNFWSGGFSYTNINDSITQGFSNLYGVRAYKGYTNSAIYVVGQDRGIIKTTAVPQTTVNGFYITNTTFAYKSMVKGDAFARKFGDTTGTGSGTTIAQGSYPDYFKVIVKGYNNGVLKNDSVTVMLADFTFTNNAQDYVLNTWNWVNTSTIGEVDSLQFFMRSSDEGDFGINTPLFFAMDNFSTGDYDYTSLKQNSKNNLDVNVYPNPTSASVKITVNNNTTQLSTATVTDVSGKIIFQEQLNTNGSVIDLSSFENGVYFLEIVSGDRKTIKKLIKN